MRIIPIRMDQMSVMFGMKPETAKIYRGLSNELAWLLLRAKGPENRPLETRVIVGDVNMHVTLLIFWKITEERPANPRERLFYLKTRDAELVEEYKDQVIGGGYLDSAGKIDNWKTRFFKTETAAEFRPLVLGKLRETLATFFPTKDAPSNGTR
ncbi:hypothetical protein A2856_01895 [Candidatus Uhrbacteria bacterium RIFCSPHIGHO2_01_FULL_63_20]|uniref:Uncharacterized protein n=1 Tax=Candidatus Uhrbacteria bacterium RIFCSPHIGHO2_01_FULL_63_20 TaxID=1802385 RepID=A0A1F7TKB6_9BACT|nr:MAG: hypothetical protein A2856_01895 [Candidatus Uhrbacteria bacterium RIFCSPHIGHO2_01_FULL_63_20]